MSRAPKMGLQWGLEGHYKGLVFGVDEVGRGPWAGPVVAAAACLNPDRIPVGLGDSKILSEVNRNRIAGELEHVAIAQASVAEIDEMNILAASQLAMRRAVEALAAKLGAPEMLLIDGKLLPAMPYPAMPIIKGDGSVASIAAAAIAAKVFRDALMVDLDRQYPGYGWASNKGYGTKAHQIGLDRLGVTPEHRKSFAPVKKILEKMSE